MTAWTWHHAPRTWHLATPGLPRAPHLRSARQREALRAGLIVALCAILAGSCGVHLRGALQGPLVPTPTQGAARA